MPSEILEEANKRVFNLLKRYRASTRRAKWMYILSIPFLLEPISKPESFGLRESI